MAREAAGADVDMIELRGVYEPVFRLVPWCRPACAIDPELRTRGGGTGTRQELRFITGRLDGMGRETAQAWWFSDAGLSLRQLDTTAARMVCRSAVQGFLIARAWRIDHGKAAAPACERGGSGGGSGGGGAVGLKLWAREGVEAQWGYDPTEPGALDRVLHQAVCWMVQRASLWATAEEAKRLAQRIGV